MTTKFTAAFVAAMVSAMTMSANNEKKNNQTQVPDNTLPGVTVVASNSARTLEVFGKNDVRQKFEYNLDNQGRVASRVSYVYIDSNKKWLPYAAYSVFYGQDETVLSYAEYSTSSKTFTKNAQQQRFNAADYPEVIRIPEACK